MILPRAIIILRELRTYRRTRHLSGRKPAIHNTWLVEGTFSFYREEITPRSSYCISILLPQVAARWAPPAWARGCAAAAPPGASPPRASRRSPRPPTRASWVCGACCAGCCAAPHACTAAACCPLSYCPWELRKTFQFKLTVYWYVGINEGIDMFHKTSQIEGLSRTQS